MAINARFASLVVTNCGSADTVPEISFDFISLRVGADGAALLVTGTP